MEKLINIKDVTKENGLYTGVAEYADETGVVVKTQIVTLTEVDYRQRMIMLKIQDKLDYETLKELYIVFDLIWADAFNDGLSTGNNNTEL